VDFLERLALDKVVADLADEQDHRRRVLERRMHGNTRIGGTGPARHEADAGLASQLAMRLGHIAGATLLPAYHRRDRILMIVERVDTRQIALAGHEEYAPDALDTQLLDQDLTAIARAQRTMHGYLRAS